MKPKTDSYISLQEAAKCCEHSQEYLSLRARQGKLRAVKIGRNWVIKKEWLEEYLTGIEEYNNNLKTKKTKPARIGYAEGVAGGKVIKVKKVKVKVKKVEKEVLVPKNLPIGEFQLAEVRPLHFRVWEVIQEIAGKAARSPAFRFGFAWAMVFVLIIAGTVFGRTSLEDVFKGVSYLAETVGTAGNIVIEETIAAPVKESFSTVCEDVEIGLFKIESKISKDEIYSAAVYGTINAFKEYGQWLGGGFKNQISKIKKAPPVVATGKAFGFVWQNIKKGYVATDNFIGENFSVVGNRISQFGERVVNGAKEFVKGIRGIYLAVTDGLCQAKALASAFPRTTRFVFQSFQAGWQNIREEYIAVNNYIEEKTSQGWEGVKGLADQVLDGLRFIVQPWRILPSKKIVIDKAKEMKSIWQELEKLKEEGLIGLTGPPGPVGPPGSQGSQGSIGPTGLGLTGSRGSRGNRGPQGPPGNAGLTGSFSSGGNIAAGAITAITTATPQLKAGYDSSNYSSLSVDSAGDLTLTATGGDITTSGNLAVTGDFTVSGAQTYSGAGGFITTTTPQLKVGYNDSNYSALSVDTNGDLILTATGGDISLGTDNITTTGTGTFGGIDVNGDVGGSYAPSIVGAGSGRGRVTVQPKLVEYFDDETEWSTSSASVAADTTNYMASQEDTAQSVKLTITSGAGIESGFMSKTISSTDLTNTVIYFRFYVHEGSGASSYTNIEDIRLYVSDSGWSNYQNLKIWDVITGWGPGWHEMVLSPRMIAVEAGTYDACYGSVVNMRLRINLTSNTQNPSVSFDKIMFIPETERARYAITFDDGSSSDYKYAVYLASKGIRATFYINPGKIGTAGYLTLDQLRKMQTMGHLIANHGYSHINPRDYTDAEFAEDVRKGAEWLVNNGFSQGAKIFAMPGGTAGWEIPDDKDTFHLLYWEQIRLTGRGEVDDPGFLDPTLLYSDDIDGTTEAETRLINLKQGIDSTGPVGTILVTSWHAYNEGTDFTWADWKTHIDNVITARDAGQIDVVTMVDLLHLTENRSPLYIDRANDKVGIGTTGPDARLEINHATGDSLRLTYDDSDGSATNYTDFSLNSTGGLTLTGSAASIASGASAEKTFLTLTPATITLTGTTQVTSLMDTYLFNRATIAGDTATVTVDDAATLTIAGPPAEGANVSLTEAYGLKINTAATTATTAYGFYVDAPTGAASNYGAIFASGNVGIGMTAPGAKLEILMSATDQYGFYVDGETNPYTGSGYSHMFRGRRTYDYGTNDFDPDISGALFYVTHQSSDAKLTANKQIMIEDMLLTLDGKVTNNTTDPFSLYAFSANSKTDNNATYDSSSTGTIRLHNRNFYAVIDEDSTFSATGGVVTNRINNEAFYALVNSNPTLLTGNLLIQNMGLHVFLEGTTVGWSFNYGVYIEKVSGADENWGIYDASGADWALDSDSQKIIWGADQDASIYWTTDGDDHLKLDPQELAAGHYVVLNVPKTTTGDPANPVEGLIYWNTADDKIKMYAESDWRELASWAADISEYAPAAEDVETGDLVVISKDKTNPIEDPGAPFLLEKSTELYQANLIGVIADITGGASIGDKKAEHYKPLVLAGRVSVKVSLENGPIESGDYLTSSSAPGVAMKATQPGPVIGKALESFDENEEQETIMVFINIGWYGGQLAEDGSIDNENDEEPEVTISGFFIQKVKQVLVSLGLFIQDGIAQVKEIITEKLFVKTARIEKIEMVDQRTGDIYCTWIEYGETKRVKGECSTIEFSDSSDGNGQTGYGEGQTGYGGA